MDPTLKYTLETNLIEAVARECANWIREKATFKSNKSQSPMQQFIFTIKGDEYSGLHAIKWFYSR